MKEGDTIHVVRDHDTAPDASPNTKLVAAALASGSMFAGKAAFSDTIEETPRGPRRTRRSSRPVASSACGSDAKMKPAGVSA